MTSMPADELTFESMPGWLREATVQRLNGYLMGNGKSPGWQVLAHMALDESGLKPAHRGVLRVLLTFRPGSSWPQGEIGRRAGVSEGNMHRHTRDLEAWGWLDVDRVRGGRQGHCWTVTVPLEQPPDRIGSEAKSAAGRRRRAEVTPSTCRGSETMADDLTPATCGGSDTGPDSTTPATCGGQPLQLARKPRQVAREPLQLAGQGTREPEEPLEPITHAPAEAIAPTTADDEETTTTELLEERWAWVINHILWHPISRTINTPSTQRRVADAIIGHHGRRVDNDVVTLILDETVRRLNAGASQGAVIKRSGRQPRVDDVLADVLGITNAELIATIEQHHQDRRKAS